MANAKKTTASQLRHAFSLLAAVAPFKVGDTVKVLRKFENNELGSECYDCNDEHVGKEVRVLECGCTGEYYVGNSDWDCSSFPFFCLELVRPAASVTLNDEYTAIVSGDGKNVAVGCQDIPAAKVIELADLIKTVQFNQPAQKPAKKAAAKKGKAKVKKSPARSLMG